MQYSCYFGFSFPFASLHQTFEDITLVTLCFIFLKLQCFENSTVRSDILANCATHVEKGGETERTIAASCNISAELLFAHHLFKHKPWMWSRALGS